MMTLEFKALSDQRQRGKFKDTLQITQTFFSREITYKFDYIIYHIAAYIVVTNDAKVYIHRCENISKT